jgi:hypothetical protein
MQYWRADCLFRFVIGFRQGKPAGVTGVRRSLDGADILVCANLAPQPAALPPALLDETGIPLYARGWDQDAGSLDAHGCLVAPLR